MIIYNNPLIPATGPPTSYTGRDFIIKSDSDFIMRIQSSSDEIFPANEGKLKEKYFHIAKDEARLWLFRKMLEKGLATRDIQAFVSNQAELRREFRQIDMDTIKVAMKAKHKDTAQHIKTLKVETGELRTKILEGFGDRKYKLKKMCKQMKSMYYKLKENIIAKYKTKIEHLTKIQREKDRDLNERKKMKIQTTTPNSLRHYESLTIFKPSNQFPRPKPRVGPYICDPKIKHTPEELIILSKQPKFSVREEIRDLGMLQETERMLIKHGINEETRENKERDKKEGIYTERKIEIHTDSPKEERKRLLD